MQELKAKNACSRVGSNHRLLAHKTSALTTELQGRALKSRVCITYKDISFDPSRKFISQRQ